MHNPLHKPLRKEESRAGGVSGGGTSGILSANNAAAPINVRIPSKYMQIDSLNEQLYDILEDNVTFDMRRGNTKGSDVTSAARGLTGTGSRNGAQDEGLASNPDVKQIINR